MQLSLNFRSYSPLFLSMFMLTACENPGLQPASSPASPESLAVSTPNSTTSVEVIPASGSECANGGSVIRLFRDANLNGLHEFDEVVISSTPVCNGAVGATGATGATGAQGAQGEQGVQGVQGAQGVGAGIILSSANSASCPAGGTIIETFQDLNSNGAQESGESVTSSSTICNGVAGANGSNGSNGSDGTNGIDGKSAFITASAASVTQCPAGGVVYSTHVDGGVPQVSVICNGVNGANGVNGVNGTNGTNGQNGSNAVFESGAVGSDLGNGLSACHHDYLYIPSAEREDRGWLIFRHQKNGAADQGIGNSGFNVWNVDVSDFYLVSEQRNEVYCQLHWEPGKRLLTYLVVSRLDRRNGEQGEIDVSR